MNAPPSVEAEHYLTHETQFRLGVLPTEQSHPITRELSQVLQKDVLSGLRLLNRVDEQIAPVFERVAASGVLDTAIMAVVDALEKNHRVFFTGCGATGRLSIQMESWWRHFWKSFPDTSLRERYENQVLSVMAGGDYALITSVERFEDYAAFGRKQIQDLGLRAGDVVFAVTEGGETSHVIGTAHAGIAVGATVFFVYNNPDDVLCAHIERSREIITHPAVTTINLTTGPQAIAGSTRMQAASIETLVLGCVLEVVLYRLLRALPSEQLATLGFTSAHTDIRALAHASREIPGIVANTLPQLARLVTIEANVYREGGNFTAPNDPHPNRGYALYVAGESSGIVVLTDTTERSPTFSTPPFRRQDQPTRKASPVYLAIDAPDNRSAWRSILQRELRGLDWDAVTYDALLGSQQTMRVPNITNQDILQFVLDGPSVLQFRPIGAGNLVVGVCLGPETQLLSEPSFVGKALASAHAQGGTCAIIAVDEHAPHIPAGIDIAVVANAPRSPLRVMQAIMLKLLLNTLSTGVMTLVGRVSGNYMTYVTPTNKKLIDRATRLIVGLTGLSYDDANQYLFAVLADTQEDRTAGRGVPPLVNVAVVRAKCKLSTRDAIVALQRHDGLLQETLDAVHGRYGI